MGINRRLMAGTPSISDNLEITIKSPSGDVIDTILPTELKRSDWGAVYERCVGLHYELLGYTVDYHGARLGYNDGGVDLIAKCDGETRFIQCKFKLSSAISRSQIEWILYKASSLLHKQAVGSRQIFDLVVPSIQLAFPTKRASRSGRIKPNLAMLAFLARNQSQSRVHLAITEIPMPVANSNVGHHDEGHGILGA
jgi:hypothetical protein